MDALTARLAALEAELNRAVYALFKLDEGDIALLEGGAASSPAPDTRATAKQGDGK